MINLDKIPHSPGVYLMKNKQNEIIYIGKAKDLHNRVSSYFHKEGQTVKTQFLVEKIEYIDFITTNREQDALILENQLIKQHLPYYNINLKDGKSYTRLAIDYNHRFPRIYVTREQSRKNVRYFGPYPSAYNTRSLSDIAEKLFFLRRCKVTIPAFDELKKNAKPCILYHLKKCYGACIWKEEEASYKGRLKQYITFLNGKFAKVEKQLKKDMQYYAENMYFEQAAKTRDFIKAITEIKQEQKIYFESDRVLDLFGYYGQENHHTFVMLRFDHGQLVHKRVLNTSYPYSLKEMMKTVLEQVYVQEVLEEEDRLKEVIFTEKHSLKLEQEEIALVTLPDEMIIPNDLDDLNTEIKTLFKDFHSKDVSLTPNLTDLQIKSLKQMAFENAQAEWKSFSKVTQTEYALVELKRILNLKREPYKIETYDISNIGDHFAVGSCVSFYMGLPDKKHYRHFKMKYVTEQNDFAMIQETLLRRFKLDMEHPDLVVIDGGKGQVSAAKEVLDAMGVKVSLIGLAKKEELIILPDSPDPIKLDHKHAGLKILMHSRDEAHRFANRLRKSMVTKKTLQNNLDSIKGLSSRRKNILLKQFGSLENLKNYSPEEIKEQTGVPISVIMAVLEYLNA